MKFGEYVGAGKPVIAIVGAMKVGKTTIADEIKKRTGGQVWHARQFYRELIVPEYYVRSGNQQRKGQTFRDQTVEAADWWYKKDPSMMVNLMRERVEVVQEPFIVESFRVLGDVKGLAGYDNVRFVVVVADEETRVQRLLASKDNIDGRVTVENARALLRFNDTHYNVHGTVEFVKSLPDAVVVDTSGLQGVLPDWKFWS